MTVRTQREYPASGGGLPFLAATIGRAFETQRQNWRRIAVVGIVALAPAAIVQGGLESAAADADGVRALLLLGLAAAAGLIGYYILSAVIAQMALARRRGADCPALGTIARALPWATLVAVDVVVSTGTAIGLELLIVPGVVFGTWFALAPVLVETHHLHARSALERSRDLVRGHFVSVMFVLTFVLVGTVALSEALHLISAAVIPGSGAVEYAGAALVAGAFVKPFAAVVTVELALELDAAG